MKTLDQKLAEAQQFAEYFSIGGDVIAAIAEARAILSKLQEKPAMPETIDTKPFIIKALDHVRENHYEEARDQKAMAVLLSAHAAFYGYEAGWSAAEAARGVA